MRGKSSKFRSSSQRTPRRPGTQADSKTNLPRLIEQDAPLQNHNLLVLMYGSFQSEMMPQERQGVGSWLKERIQKHGLPSLVRFGSHRRAQVFSRTQFQAWLEPLVAES